MMSNGFASGVCFGVGLLHDAGKNSKHTSNTDKLAWRIKTSFVFGSSPFRNKQVDATEERNVSGAPPKESALWALSTDTCSLQPSAQASRLPWQRRMDAPGHRPAGSVRASGTCARSRASP